MRGVQNVVLSTGDSWYHTACVNTTLASSTKRARTTINNVSTTQWHWSTGEAGNDEKDRAEQDARTGSSTGVLARQAMMRKYTLATR
eukprot:617547-Rhodomonas_salina.1